MPEKCVPQHPPTPWAPPQVRRIRHGLLQWFDRGHRDLPWRRTRDPYAIFVSELMLQQTQVAAATPYFRRWMARFPTWRALAQAPVDDVLRAWEGLGYYRRARNLHAAAQQVARDHAGVLPPTLEAVAALPGAGRYTAGAVASIAFGVRAPAVDGNAARVLARLADYAPPADTPASRARFWAWAEALVPPDRPGDFNQAVMELGATVCVPGRPRCELCPLRADCRAKDPAALPARSARKAAEAVVWDVAADLRPGPTLLLVRAGPGERWQGLWRLPDLPHPAAGAPMAQVRAAFTRYRVELRAFAHRFPRAPRDAVRADPRAMASLPMPAPHRRLADLLLPGAPPGR